MPVNFFAPILESAQEVFQLDDTALTYKIKYSIPAMMNESDIKHIQTRIIGYVDNQNYIKYDESISPDGILYSNFSPDSEHSVSISINNLTNNQWISGQLYKIQLRFGESPLWGQEKFSEWRAKQINKFSEWSNVMIIKPISKPKLIINGQEILPDSEIISAQNTEITLTPTFIGSCKFRPEDKEIVEKYKFNLYNNEKKLIESSGWKLREQENQYDTHRFKTLLTNQQTYQVSYDILSNNNYQSDLQDSPSTALYSFKTDEKLLPSIDGISIEADDKSIDSIEDAKIKIYLSSTKELFGNYVLVRSSEKTNFTVWEDLTYLYYSGNILNKELSYTDYTIDSGVKYKYAIQREGAKKFRTPLVYEEGSPERLNYFEYTYLFSKKSQLKLKFNNKISTFKNVVLSNKSDTLGSKYPTILRNGNAYYAEFPISGLISLQADEFNAFFEKREDGYYFKEEKVLASKEDFSTNLTNQNIQLEKIFRDKVELFLNDGESKLYKSATEGNLIVNLMNVTLTPIQSLGRIIYEFTATAYEVAENNLDNLNHYGIIKRVPEKDSSTEDIYNFTTFGQLNGEFIGMDQPQQKKNLIEEIQKDIKASSNGKEYITKLKKITSLRFQDFSNLDQGPTYPLLHLIIDGKEYVVGANKVYYLDDFFGNIQIQSIYLKETGPIILDYTCEVTKEFQEVVMVRQEQTALTWGQLNGIFSDVDFNSYSLETTFYRQNILDSIVQDLERQIYNKYPNKINATFYKKFSETSPISTYRIGEILSISIEANEYTVLKIVNQDGTESRIQLGPTEKYILNPAADLIKSISFENPSYAIIDYKCYIHYIDIQNIG